MMDKFRESRRASKRKESPKRLEGLSPEKFGKAAFQDMAYTPSKLADNVLYKQMNSMKKYEETSQRLRQVEAAFKLLDDKFIKVSKEKAGIEDSLTRQIEMYKSLIKEMEQKAEGRLREAQEAFKAEIESIVRQKQQELRFVQAEKEELEDTIAQLEQIGNELEDKLTSTTTHLNQTLKKVDNLQKDNANYVERLSAAEQQIKAQAEKAQETINDLKQKTMEAERMWRDKIDMICKQKDKELKEVQKQLRQEISKIQQDKESDKQQKIEEMRNLTKTFQTETNRLNEIITNKDKTIEQMNEKIRDEAQKANSSARGYEQQIQSLATEKARLFQQVDALNEQNTHLNVLLKDQQIVAAKEKSNLECYILKLKDDVNYTQSNFLRERDRNIIGQDDVCKEIGILKKQVSDLMRENEALRAGGKDKDALSREVRKLRDMLLQSSFQLQKCKQQFLKLGKERDLLAARLQQTSYENGDLRRIKCQREEEARSWRDSYYLSRSRRR